MTFEPQPDASGLPTAQFDVVMRGYDRSQVDDHIARLHEEMRHLAAGLRQERDLALTRSHQLAAERDNALEHLYATQDELEALRKESGGAPAAAQAQSTQDSKGSEIALFGDRLQTILATAEQEASSAKAEAQKQADSLVGEAKRRAEAMLQEARQQVSALTEKATRDAEQITAKAHQQAASTLEAATRDERDARANMAKLLTRHEQVRTELSKISQAIQALLSDEQGPQRADNGQPSKPEQSDKGADQQQPSADKPKPVAAQDQR